MCMRSRTNPSKRVFKNKTSSREKKKRNKRERQSSEEFFRTRRTRRSQLRNAPQSSIVENGKPTDNFLNCLRSFSS